VISSAQRRLLQSSISLGSIGFLVSALLVGVVIAWFTNYVLTPTESKWREARSIPFELGVWFALVVAIAGTVVFALASAARRLAGAQDGPAFLRAVTLGAAYALITLGVTEGLSRGAGAVTLLVHFFFWSCFLALPVAFAFAAVKRRPA